MKGDENADRAGRRVLRATHQNAVLIVLAVGFVFVGLLYADARIGLWIVAGVLIAAAVVNLVRVVRTNRRMGRL